MKRPAEDKAQATKKAKSVVVPYDELSHSGQVERLIEIYKASAGHPSIYNEKLCFKILKDGRMYFTIGNESKSQVHLVGKVGFKTDIYGDYHPPLKLELDDNLTAEQISQKQQEHRRVLGDFQAMGYKEVKYPSKHLWSAKQKYGLQLEPSQVSMLNQLLELAFQQISESGQQKVTGIKKLDDMLYLEAPLIGPETDAGRALKEQLDPLDMYPKNRYPNVIPVYSRKPFQTADGPQREMRGDVDLKGALVTACVTLETYVSKAGELGYKPRVHSFMLATPAFSGFASNHIEDDFPELE